ncbi:hypothetical protein ONZ45_g2150 [Pleurotus djamor]|nr:hypothetical protein ONZ45_g2150 [Pleurotus djamor]
MVALKDIPTIRVLYESGELNVSSEPKYPHNESYLDKISLIQGDITTLEVDAIVNAANRSLLGGGGVDGAIHSAAGPKLLQECRLLNGCDTGDAKLTKGYDLPSQYIVHAVGPVYSSTEVETKAAQLTSCYKTSLELAVAHNLDHIAFPSISTGIYGYPIEDATHVALETVRSFCDSNSGLDRIIFVVWSNKDRLVYEYDSGIIASVITMERYLDRFGTDESVRGAVVSSFNGGCFFGSAAAGWCNDKLGRKLTIQVGTVFALWGCAMQAGASNVATLMVGRIIAGVAIGILSMTVPLYNTEVAPPKIRGFLVGVTQQMIGIGFIVANWVGYGCQFIDSDASWRLPLGLQLAPAFLLLIGIQFLPNSPRWLLEVGRDEEAKKVVYRLHGSSALQKQEAEAEFKEMSETIKAEVFVRSRKISDLWATPAMLRRTLVAVGVQVFGQFSGINVINYFGPQMYAGLGITGGRALLVQGIYGAVGPIANFFFITLLVDRVGRKKPLMFGAASFVVTFSILAAIVASFPPPPEELAGTVPVNQAAQRAGIAMIFLTSIFFSVSFGPISWVLASEVFPTSTRSIGTSVATCANWAFNVLISQVSPLGMADSGWKFYLLFVCLNTVDFAVITLFFPETKGKSLEEMATVFGDNVNAQKVLNEHGANGDRMSDPDLKQEVEHS